MRKKLLPLARVGLSFSSNYKLAPTRLPLYRPPKWVSIQINNSVGQSKIQRCGFSYAASVPSDKPHALKGRKRVSKEERRAMVESFVKKYRELNAGKFPTATDTKKQVGGSYYVVRKIIQELKYKSEKKTLNSVDENLVEKELFDDSITLTESVMVSSGKTKAAVDRSVQNDLQLLGDEEIGNAGYKHLEEQREPQAFSRERNQCKDVTTATTGNHFVAVESDSLKKDAVEPSQSILQMLNAVKTEEAESSYTDSIATELENTAAAVVEKSQSIHGKAQSHDSEFGDVENHLMMEERSTEKAGYERREQSALKDLPEEPSQSSNQISNDFKTEEAESSFLFLAPESESLKEGIENVAASSSEKSGSSHSKAESHDSEFGDMENYQEVDSKGIEKAGYERKEQSALEDLPGTNDPNHKTEQCQASFGLDESNSDNSNRETGITEVSKKSTFWGNIKSFADGIMNMWRKL